MYPKKLIRTDRNQRVSVCCSFFIHIAAAGGCSGVERGFFIDCSLCCPCTCCSTYIPVHKRLKRTLIYKDMKQSFFLSYYVLGSYFLKLVVVVVSECLEHVQLFPARPITVLVVVEVCGVSGFDGRLWGHQCQETVSRNYGGQPSVSLEGQTLQFSFSCRLFLLRRHSLRQEVR